MRTIFLIDDHPVVGAGLGLVLRDSAEFKLLGVACDPAEGLRALHASRPDALVLDLVFSGMLRVDFVAMCRAAIPDAVIVVFSSLSQSLYRDQAIAAGADTYVAKSTDLATLSQCILGLFSARPLAPREPSAAQTSAISRLPTIDGIHLTRREMDVARRLAHGQPIAFIAEALGMSVKTAAVHRDNLRQKLNCRDTMDLVARLARLDGSADGRD